jgi:hypothetical protein
MRLKCLLWGLLGIAIAALSSCTTPQPSLKPPLHEEYVLPPGDDPRFSTPPTYPKEALDSGLPKKDPSKAGGDSFRGPGAPRFGGGGMGGGY